MSEQIALSALVMENRKKPAEDQRTPVEHVQKLADTHQHSEPVCACYSLIWESGLAIRQSCRQQVPEEGLRPRATLPSAKSS